MYPNMTTWYNAVQFPICEWVSRPFSLQKRLQFLFWLFIKLLYVVIISIFKEIRYCSFDTPSFKVIPRTQNWLKSWILIFLFILFSYQEIVNFDRILNSESNMISNKYDIQKISISLCHQWRKSYWRCSKWFTAIVTNKIISTK